MAIQKITADDQETFTLETCPERTFSSSSSGITGSVNVFARRSSIEKEIFPLSLFSSSFYLDQNLDELRRDILRVTGSSNITDSVSVYLDAVTSQQASARKQQQLEIYRFNPPFRLNSNSLRKTAVVDGLMPFYRTVYPRTGFSTTNYNCLNFYTASNVPAASVLLYPNPIRNSAVSSLTSYGFTGSFSFDFWIKPKYTTDFAGVEYKAGTIMHLTGAYALTLHSGSSKDLTGKVDAFRIGLQLSSSANVRPSQILPSNYLSFKSDDNSIPINAWSHVTVRWGGTNYNFGSGSFLVNGIPRGSFVISSSLNVGDQGEGDPSVLCVGNYYEGQNSVGTALTQFFTNDTTEREGLYEMDGGTGFSPTSYDFTHPLNAEVHELKLYERYLNSVDVAYLGEMAPKGATGDGLLFYLPPFFTHESPTRKFYGTFGGIPVTPFFGKDGATHTPFAKEMAFGCGGHYINLENYVRDFATGRYARLWNLTGSTIDTTFPTAKSANAILYETGSNVKRLYTVLPCDNGTFTPNFNLLSTLNTSSFTNDLGIYERGVISLRNMITESFSSDTMIQETGSIVSALVGGAAPGSAGDIPGDSLAIYHRTRDGSSNQVVLFDVSNLFYGNQIKPGSFSLEETTLSASDGKFGFKLKDDGLGNLYRADADGQHATWSTVGNIFYNEGVILIKSPQLYFFGETDFTMNFKGMQNIHVLTINAYARPMQLISSSNPSYMSGAVDAELANNTDTSRYVYITHVNLHDDNLNVIARTAVAQPILKRSGDKLLFKIKMDF